MYRGIRPNENVVDYHLRLEQENNDYHADKFVYSLIVGTLILLGLVILFCK